MVVCVADQEHIRFIEIGSINCVFPGRERLVPDDKGERDVSDDTWFDLCIDDQPGQQNEEIRHHQYLECVSFHIFSFSIVVIIRLRQELPVRQNTCSYDNSTSALGRKIRGPPVASNWPSLLFSPF